MSVPVASLVRKTDVVARFGAVSEQKARGETYTPTVLADFVAQQIVREMRPPSGRPVRVLDPAVGHGELLVCLLERLRELDRIDVEVHGFEIDQSALKATVKRLEDQFPNVPLHIEPRNFLSFVLDGFHPNAGLLAAPDAQPYDLIIANPPYVRTQVMGASQARRLADLFGLSGRVDLYYAFVLGLSQVLGDDGVAGMIVSNRFMTTKSGESVRRALVERVDVIRAWDLGDTRLFDAAVLPAVLVMRGRAPCGMASRFTSIYQTMKPATSAAVNPIDALMANGVVSLDDGRRFEVRHGQLKAEGSKGGVWRLATKDIDGWLATVDNYCWRTFGDIGKVRVGVKTCADKVFIRDDWNLMSGGPPELLRPLATHHIGGRYKPLRTNGARQILYPHEVVQGRRRAVDLQRHPLSRAYLEQHREALERRRYVLDAGRTWYELWVPQDPNAWRAPKLVFRDIAEEPTFWIDRDGSVVNGDCYWLTCDVPPNSGLERDDLLWLAAAVGNSSLVERFYDYRFNNKLYAGRRRYATQYVEQFPLPDPNGTLGKAIIEKTKGVEACVVSAQISAMEEELNSMVWEAFGVRP